MFLELLKGNASCDEIDSLRQKYGLFDSHDYRNSTKLEDYLQPISTHNVDDIKFVDVAEVLNHTKTEESHTEYDCNNAVEDAASSYTPDRNKPKAADTAKSIKSTAKKRKVSTTIKRKETNRKYVKGSDEVWCHLCDINFNQHNLYVRHMREKHCPDVLPFACVQCPKFFASEKKMLQHASSHRPVEQKKIHSCPECDRTFSRAENVQLHIRSVHRGVRSFVCEECGKTWATKQQLQKHQLMHIEARPFQCSDCSKCFKDSTSLKKHLEIHSNISFECLLCGQRSSTRYTLREHMLVHSDEKRYKCQYCGNTFKRYKTLKVKNFSFIWFYNFLPNPISQNHWILHTGMRLYECSFCDITYSKEPNLRAHKKKCHSVELAAME